MRYLNMYRYADDAVFFYGTVVLLTLNRTFMHDGAYL